MGIFTDVLEHLDRGSNALQGFYTQGFDLDALEKGWNLEEQYDFEDMWRDAPQSERGWSDREGFLDHASYVGSVPFNLVGDPINVVGAKMLTAPYNFIKGGSPEAVKGMYTTSSPNYIKDFYGPSDESIAWADAEMARLGRPREMYKGNPDLNMDMYKADRNALLAQAKLRELGKWGALGAGNAARMFMSPRHRAMYRETGINRPMMESPWQSPGALTTATTKAGKPKSTRGKEVELIHRTFANRHISEQAGRVGPTKALDEMMDKGFYSTYHKNTPGTYNKLSSTKIKGGYPETVTKKDFNDIEHHIKVWKDGKGQKFGFGDRDHIIIKKHKSPYSGDHWEDWQRSPIISDLAKAFAVGKEVPPKPYQLAEHLKKEGIDLPNMIVDVDGIQFSWSKPGRSITEGGVNLWAKIKPDGKIVGVMSDEHNLFEKLPGMSKMVPNRVVAVTPPMTADIRTLKPKQTGSTEKALPGAQDTAEWVGEHSRLIMDAPKPSKEALDLERKAIVNQFLGSGLLMAPNGMFSSQE